MQKEKDKVFLQRMTATQTLKIYQILNKHFKNNEDASVVVQEIEEIVDKKNRSEKGNTCNQRRYIEFKS